MIKRVLLGLLLCSVPLLAQSYTKPIADVTVAGTAVTVFTSTDIVAGNGHPAATGATCAVSAAAVRLTFDGTTPTTALGYLAAPGQYIISGTSNLLNMQAVRNSSTSGVLSCVVYSPQ